MHPLSLLGPCSRSVCARRPTVHGEPAGDVLDRPWGERSFYVVDPWGNDLCFRQDGTRYT